MGRMGGTYLEDTSNKFPYTLYCAYLPPWVRTLLILASPEAEAEAAELDSFVAMFGVQICIKGLLHLSNHNYKTNGEELDQNQS